MLLRLLDLTLLFCLLCGCQSGRVPIETPLTEQQLNSYKFYPGLITTQKLEENCISFTADESWAFWTAGDDWEKQLPFLAKKEQGRYQEAQQIIELDTIYNGAISPSGNRILYSTRQGEATSTWLTELSAGKWKQSINLSESSGIKAGYFHWYTEQELYFYVPEQGGDIATGTLTGNSLKITPFSGTINTTATEFSPFMGPRKRFLIFTRYQEGKPAQQGFFYSQNKGNEQAPRWSHPRKIEELPYGWGGFLSRNGKTFFFTDGIDIFAIPFSLLTIGKE